MRYYRLQIKLDLKLAYILILTFNSCALLGIGSHDSDYSSGSQAYMDQEVQDTSRALHHYLIGQMALKEQEFPIAIDNFAKTRDLSKQSVPQVNRKLAELYIREGKLDHATEELKQLLKDDPNDREALFLYAGALQSLNKDAEAIRIYEQLITLFPEQMEASVLLAGVYEQQDLKAEARKVLEEFIKRNQNNPNTAIVLYYLAKLYENNNYNLALEAYKKAYLIDAKTERSLRAYVLLALKNGRFKEVGELCKIALGQQENKKFPQLIIDSLKMTNKEEFVSKIITELEDSDLNLKSEAEIRFKLALLFIEQHQLKEALRELHFVLADNPKHNQARFYIATIYAGAGKIQQALQYLQQIDPGQEIFLKSRTLGAYIAKQNGQADLAEKFIREAHQSNPADEKIFSYYLLILKDSKKYHEAAEMLKTRIDAGNPSIQNLFQYGIVLHDLGKQSQALDVMEQVLQKDSEHADALNFIAYGLAEKKKELPKALEYIQRALKKNPNDPFYLDTLGWVYFRMGQNKTAEEHLAKAVSLSDNDSVLLDHYADVLFELGQLDRALIHYRQALEVEFDKTNGDPRLIKHVEGKINKIRSKLNKKSN